MSKINIKVRRKGREAALFALFAYQMIPESGKSSVYENVSCFLNSVPDNDDPIDSEDQEDLVFDSPYDYESLEFGKRIYTSVIEHRKEIDEAIIRNADNWDIDRVAIIDRSILWIGISEILYFDDIPDKVAINESIELAKIFSTEKSGTFVNGILDPIAFKEKEL